MNNELEILEIIASNLNMEISDLNVEMNIREDLDADSLDLMTIITDLEDKYDFVFDETKIDEIVYIKDLINYING